MIESRPRQLPGVYRRRIGDAMVTVINDGFLDIPFQILHGIEETEMKSLMQERFYEGEPRLTVNAFVIETHRNTVLIDAGGGSSTVYSMGRLPDSLAVAGFEPEDFDTILLTHIHPDHSSGLIDAEGNPLFPKATIVVHEDELNFWSNTERRAHSAAAAPYIDSADMLLESHHGRFRPSTGGEVLPGITQLHMPGHTPGHCGYQLDSAGETLVIWGDTVHVPEIQIPYPQVTNEYDIEESLAIESRRRIFEHVARERLLVTGGHLHLPGFAHLAKSHGRFQLVSEPWQLEI